MPINYTKSFVIIIVIITLKERILQEQISEEAD